MGSRGSVDPSLFRVCGAHAAFDPPTFCQLSDFDPHFSLPSVASVCTVTSYLSASTTKPAVVNWQISRGTW